MVEFLIGVFNKGEIDYIIETINSSFRYPMDFNFYIQNFTTISYNKIVKPNHEATLSYNFLPAESFAGRPFGLNINLNYKDSVSIGILQVKMNTKKFFDFFHFLTLITEKIMYTIYCQKKLSNISLLSL